MKIKMVRITPHPVDAGKAMYNSYCASCHGEDGKGYGPATPALSKGAPDLTLLAAHNQGRYPKYKVITALSKFSESHHIGTTSEMPDWYKAFVSLDSTNPIKADLRAISISRHVQTLQIVR
ncbi:c-type cytochrome [Occallatibacter savannae]|uniref:c-type cytochrome n=1 Tax=Occallatibacter savannae TaxID=1002691 RepID=UPI000D69632B|nr:cytochrome c [Occallatibacter savannae]